MPRVAVFHVLAAFVSLTWRPQLIAPLSLFLSHCASRLHVPVIPSFSPSIFQQHSCCARICLGLSRQQYTAKQTKNGLVSYTNFGTIIDTTYLTCCSHSSSTTTLYDLAPQSGSILLPPLTPRPRCTLQLLDLAPRSNSSCQPSLCPPL